MQSIRVQPYNSFVRIQKPFRKTIRPANSVLPQVTELLTNYVCPVISDCHQMYIGDEVHQLHVIKQLFEIADKFNITNGEGWVMRALFQDDEPLALKIAKAVNDYNVDIQTVRDAISKVPSLPHIPSV
jgi:hypothetical protein